MNEHFKQKRKQPSKSITRVCIGTRSWKISGGSIAYHLDIWSWASSRSLSLDDGDWDCQDHARELVDGIDFYVTEEFGSRLYDSCKDVKFAAMNTRAMDFIGAGAKNYSGTRLVTAKPVPLHLRCSEVDGAVVVKECSRRRVWLSFPNAPTANVWSVNSVQFDSNWLNSRILFIQCSSFVLPLQIGLHSWVRKRISGNLGRRTPSLIKPLVLRTRHWNR